MKQFGEMRLYTCVKLWISLLNWLKKHILLNCCLCSPFVTPLVAQLEAGRCQVTIFLLLRESSCGNCWTANKILLPAVRVFVFMLIQALLCQFYFCVEGPDLAVMMSEERPVCAALGGDCKPDLVDGGRALYHTITRMIWPHL